MDEEQKHYLRLSLLILTISILYLIKYIPSILFNPSSERLLNDLFDLLVPIIGFSTIYEFLRPKRDQFGWGGILFNIMMIICVINFTILSIQGLFSFSFEITYFLGFVLNISVCILSWFCLLLYYD